MTTCSSAWTKWNNSTEVTASVSHLKRMLHTLMKNLIIMNWLSNVRKENPIDVSVINSLEALENKADKYNKDNLLYQVVKLSVIYMENELVTFNGLSYDAIIEHITYGLPICRWIFKHTHCRRHKNYRYWEILYLMYYVYGLLILLFHFM